jgi:ATP-dependent DNA helicase RecG
MVESQNIEYKESGRDEYLKWVCGFANAHGGKIYIGINDKGFVNGIQDSKKLLVDIPNMIKDTMQIIAEVNLHNKDGKDFIEIIVSPSTYPVSYDSTYHYRSGSTKQQFRGAALTDFLLSKTGKKWDEIPVDNVSVSDLDKESFDIFRREAVKSRRMTKADLDMTNEELLDSLSLIVDGKLKRAAVLLFHRKPEKWVTGCYTKIGRFGEGADLLYHDEVNGSLFIQADRIVDLIYLKYLKADISYDKETRIETYPYPREAIREVVFNALIHTNWADRIPIQIRIEDDAMYISNSCILPPDLNAETLLKRHRSTPYNPDIANGFFRAGYVETWGRGIQKICEECKAYGTAPPEFIINTRDIMVKMTALMEHNKALNDEKVMVEGEKVVVEDKKVVVDAGKVVVGDEKVMFERYDSRLIESKASNVMRENIKIVYNNLSGSQSFGRKEIAIIMGCTEINAGKIINVMKGAGIIVPVKGKGKGKYIFL